MRVGLIGFDISSGDYFVTLAISFFKKLSSPNLIFRNFKNSTNDYLPAII